MPLSGSALTSALQSALAPWNGPQLSTFCTAIGNGIVNASTGQITFVTVDTGLTPGVGVGTGVGITGMSASNIQSQMYSKGQSFWSSLQNNGPGVEWMGFCEKCAKAINDHFKANALLTSTDTPVYLGTGMVTVYAGVTVPAVKSMIVSLVPGSWTRFPELAEAVATGFVMELTTHSPTDSVVITGSPISPPPVPGAGAGSGIVT